jgi:DNA-binding SARP family transcriptional activator
LGPTQRALLAYLAMHPQASHRRETLTGLLWLNRPEAEARHNLAQALYRLRAGSALCHGEFLTDFWMDSALDEEWLVAQREELHRQVLGIR